MLTSQWRFWVMIIFLRCKVHSVRHTYLFNFYLSKIKCKRPEVNSEPTHFQTLMNDGKAFSSLDGTQLPVTWPVSVSTKTLISQGIGSLETLKSPANLFRSNLNNTKNNMSKTQKKKKKKKGWWNCGITNTSIKQNS